MSYYITRVALYCIIVHHMIAHQKSTPQKCSWIFSASIQCMFSGVSDVISFFCGIIQRIVTSPMDFHWNCPMDFQWHAPTECRFCNFWCAIFCPDHGPGNVHPWTIKNPRESNPLKSRFLVRWLTVANHTCLSPNIHVEIHVLFQPAFSPKSTPILLRKIITLTNVACPAGRSFAICCCILYLLFAIC